MMQFPFVLLDITMPPDTFDINVSRDKSVAQLTYETELVEYITGELLDLYPTREGGVAASPQSSERESECCACACV